MNKNMILSGQVYLHPHEHALSPLGRYHKLSSYRRFNKAVANLTHDVPSLCPAALSRSAFRNLQQACASDEQHYEDFLSAHTLYDFYKPFTPVSLLNGLVDEKPILPEGYRNIRHTRSWRWCSDCVNADIFEYGFPYFHKEHQLPLMTRCFTHHRALLSGCEYCDVDWKKLDKLSMPNEKGECPHCNATIAPLDGFHDQDMTWLQETSLLLLRGYSPGFDLVTLQAAYQKWLGVPYRREATGVLSLVEREVLAEAQFKLDNHFDPRLYHAIFTNTDVDPRKKRSPSLALFKAVFKPDLFLSPIIHLMIIRMMFGNLTNTPDIQSS